MEKWVKPGAVFDYTDTDHEQYCSVSGRYEVLEVLAPDKWGDVTVKVRALEVENWPGTGTIYRWDEQARAGLIAQAEE